MQPANVHPDPMPSAPPAEFLEALYKAVGDERKRLNIEPEDPISLALVVDNAHVSGFLKGVDAWDFPVIETISGATNSIAFYGGYERPLDVDFSKRDEVVSAKEYFDVSKPATEFAVGNVHFAILICKSLRETGSYEDVVSIRLSRWSGAGQALVEGGRAASVSSGMFDLLAAGYNDNFDERAFRSSKPFSRAMNVTNGYNEQIFHGILNKVRKQLNTPNATDEEIKAQLLPQTLTVIDDIKDDLPYIAYSFLCSWSALFTVTTYKATIVDVYNQASAKGVDLEHILVNNDQNQIIKHIDVLIASGYAINDLVQRLRPVSIVLNYNLLVQKGATNIDLTAMQDSLPPLFVLDNIQVFKDADVPINFSRLFSKLNDEEALHNLPAYSAKLLASGVDPQLIVDRCMAAKGSFVEFISEWLPGLVLAGAHVDQEKLIQKLLGDDSAYDLFEEKTEVSFLKKVRAVAAANVKLQDYLAGRTLYDAPGGRKLSINMDGKQTTKIFFEPRVQVVGKDGTKNLPENWAGRILPGQTIKEGIAAELKEVYGYLGRFDYSKIYFKEYAKDRNGNNIERYAVTVALLPKPGEKIPAQRC